MKNRIWKNCKNLGLSLVMVCALLAGSSAVQGAESGEYIEKTEAPNETEQEPEGTKDCFETETPELETMEPEIILEDEEMMKPAESTGEEALSEITKAPELTNNSEITENSAATDTPSFSDQEEKEIKPGYRMWITPQQEQIKAGRELLYTVMLENTGNCQLRDIQIQASFSESSLKYEWEEAENTEIQNETLKFDVLEPEIKREFYLSVQIPEEQFDKIELHLKGSAEYEEKETGERRTVVSEEKRETEILPLKADFEVTKTADRTMAVPGDKIIFQICIRNTGERTLHSVITTERFQLENVPVKFLEAEGITLNKERTKARIEKIDPESSVGLLAEVTLPEKMKEQKLINEVVVTTLETGEKKVTSKAEVQIYKTAETPTAVPVDSDEGTTEQNTETQGRAASTHPKTGDPMKPLLWLLVIPGSLLAAGWTCSRLR